MEASDLVSSGVEGARFNGSVQTFEGLLDSVQFFFPVPLQASDVLPDAGATILMYEGYMISVLFLISIVLISL